MKALKTHSIFFVIGALGYGFIEILWRGHTHLSMLAAGGICFAVFGKISRALKRINLLYKAILCFQELRYIHLVTK